MLSKYNIIVHNESRYLVYNTRTGSAIILDAASFDVFTNETCSLKRHQLYEGLGFYISPDIDEFNRILDYSNTRLLGSRIQKYRILTTTGCNAKCPYCYEKGIANKTMLSETADAVAEFIVQQYRDGKIVDIEWFGGEPLMNIPAIDSISGKLSRVLPPDSFKSSIITNASLITESVISKMVGEWNVRRIQITLDGVYDDYENVKKLGVGSFQRLMGVIEKVSLTDIHIDIRLNYDANNIEQIKRAIHYLSDTFSDRITVYAAKIFSEQSANGYFDLENETIEINQTLHDCRIKTGSALIPKSFATPCMAAYPSFFTISPIGDLFKCDRKLLDENSVGNVKTGITSGTPEKMWSVRKLSKDCQECSLFPLCWGGCSLDRDNGIYPCYLTEKIIKHNLSLLLGDLMDSCPFPVSIIKKRTFIKIVTT